MNLLDFEIQYRNRIDKTLNELQTAVLLLAQLQSRITNVGQDLQDLSQTVEDFVTQQMLDTDCQLVLPQKNEFQSRLPQMETSSFTANTNWPSPVVYPLRPPKGRKSLAAIELPTFKRVSEQVGRGAGEQGGRGAGGQRGRGAAGGQGGRGAGGQRGRGADGQRGRGGGT